MLDLNMYHIYLAQEWITDIRQYMIKIYRKYNTCNKQERHNFVKDSLDAGLNGEGGIAGLGGMVEQGRPIFDGGLSPDGFGSVMLYVLTITLHCNNNKLHC